MMFRFPALSAVTSDRSDAASHIAHSHRVKGPPDVGKAYDAWNHLRRGYRENAPSPEAVKNISTLEHAVRLHRGDGRFVQRDHAPGAGLPPSLPRTPHDFEVAALQSAAVRLIRDNSRKYQST